MLWNTCHIGSFNAGAKSLQYFVAQSVAMCCLWFEADKYVLLMGSNDTGTNCLGDDIESLSE